MRSRGACAAGAQLEDVLSLFRRREGVDTTARAALVNVSVDREVRRHRLPGASQSGHDVALRSPWQRGARRCAGSSGSAAAPASPPRQHQFNRVLGLDTDAVSRASSRVKLWEIDVAQPLVRYAAWNAPPAQALPPPPR